MKTDKLQIHNKEEREEMLKLMQVASDNFYYEAVRIQNHPFIEFAGLMNEYIKCAQAAHDRDIDFTVCNTHSGVHLPMEYHNVQYVNEKLECIFTGRSVLSHDKTNSDT